MSAKAKPWASVYEYFRPIARAGAQHLECKRCGQLIKRNSVGAASHMAKHVRALRSA